MRRQTRFKRQDKVVDLIKKDLADRMGAPVDILQLDSYNDRDLVDWNKEVIDDEYDGVQLTFRIDTKHSPLASGLNRGAVYNNCLPVMYGIRYGAYWNKVDDEFDCVWPEGMPKEYDACWHLDSIESTADPKGYWVKLTVEYCYCS